VAEIRVEELTTDRLDLKKELDLSQQMAHIDRANAHMAKQKAEKELAAMQLKASKAASELEIVRVREARRIGEVHESLAAEHQQNLEKEVTRLRAELESKLAQEKAAAEQLTASQRSREQAAQAEGMSDRQLLSEEIAQIRAATDADRALWEEEKTLLEAKVDVLVGKLKALNADLKVARNEEARMMAETAALKAAQKEAAQASAKKEADREREREQERERARERDSSTNRATAAALLLNERDTARKERETARKECAEVKQELEAERLARSKLESQSKEDVSTPSQHSTKAEVISAKRELKGEATFAFTGFRCVLFLSFSLFLYAATTASAPAPNLNSNSNPITLEFLF
jgi:hypothetical protein